MNLTGIEDDYVKGPDYRHYDAGSFGKGSELDQNAAGLNASHKLVVGAAVVFVIATTISLFFFKPTVQGMSVAEQVQAGSVIVGLIVLLGVGVLVAGLFTGRSYSGQQVGEGANLMHKAEGYVSRGKYEDALAAYDRILSKEPENSHALMNKGIVFSQMGAHQSAIKAYDKILGENSENAGALYNKGLALLEQGDNESALSCFSKSLKINKKDIPTIRKMCYVYFSNKEYDEAIKLCDKALAFDKKNIDMLIIKGLCLENLKKTDSALKFYEKALKVDPADAWASKRKHKLM